MLIDWFTVGAQTLNFLILVWLLKRFLYQPILNAIDTREKRIAHELADAAKKQKEAQQEREEFNKKNSDFDQQRSELLQQATETANTERQRLLTEARVAADDLTAKRQLSLQREQKNLNDELSRLTRAQVFAIARKTLADLSDKNVESAIVRVFIKHIHSLQDETKSTFAGAIKKANNTAFIHSAFELPDTERADIQQAINECFSADVALRFEISEGTIGGIELSAEGQLIAWSIESYLGALEKNIADSLTITRSATRQASGNAKTAIKKVHSSREPLSKDSASKASAP